MFCVSCGGELAASARFCPHCGARQTPEPSPDPSQNTAPAESAVPAEVSVPVQSSVSMAVPAAAAVAVAPPPTEKVSPAAPPPKDAKKKRVPLGVKVLLILVLLLGAALGGLKVALGYLNGPDRTIDRFLDAIRAQDAEAFSSVVTLAGGDLELNRDTLSPLFAAYSQNDTMLDYFQGCLQDDLAILEQGRTAMGRDGIRLVKRSNPLFSSYKVEISVCSVALSSEFDGATLVLDGREYLVGTHPQYIDLLPGVYSSYASYVDPATGIALESESSPRSIDRSSSAVHCSFNYCGAWLQTNVPDLELRAISIDGRPYAGALDLLNPQAGFSLSPVGADSEIAVTYAAAGLEFQRIFRIAEETYCLLESGLQTVTLGSSQPEVEITAIEVDGTPYTADLSGLNLSRGFDLGPVPAGSQIRIQFSLAGMTFEQTFPASNGRCMLEPGLPEDVQAAGEALASDLALLIIQLESSHDMDLLLQLAQTYSGASPEFVSQWAERIRAEAAEMDETDTYTLFEDLAVSSVVSQTPVFAPGRTTLTCTVETASTAVTEYQWGTNEAIRGTSGVSFPPVAVDLAYADGQWQVLNVSWEP